MAREKRVPDLACDDPVSESAIRVLSGRLGELRSRHELAASPDDSTALHDLRIAAKRLRYSLETFAFCFPDGHLDEMADDVRALQDVLGRVHDLDEMLVRLTAQVAALDASRTAQAMKVLGEAAGEDAAARLRVVLDDPRERDEALGLFTVIGRKLTERRRRHSEYVALWDDWERRGVLERLSGLVGTADGEQGL